MSHAIEPVTVEPGDQVADYITQSELDAEATVLAAMMASARYRHAIRGRISPEMLGSPRNRALLEATTDAEERAELGDGAGMALAAIPGVTAALERARAVTPEMRAHLGRVVECAPYSDGQLDQALDRIEAAYARRTMRATGQRLVHVADHAQGRSVEELRDAAAQATTALHDATTSKGDDGAAVGDGWSGFVADLEHGRDTVVRTGFLDLDHLVQIERGNVVLLGARTSIGKSVMGLNLARRIAETQPDTVRATYLSYEMSRKQCLTRLASGVTRIPAKQIKNRQLSAAEWGRLREAEQRLPRNLFVPDAPSRRLETALATIYREAARADADGRTAVVFIDYVQQLIPANGRFPSERERLTYASNALQQAAQESGAVVVELAQLNRDADHRSDKVPELADIYGSGAFEHDANTSILLYRPCYYDKNDRPGEMDLIVAKQRDGETGRVTVAHQLQYQLIVDMAVE